MSVDDNFFIRSASVVGTGTTQFIDELSGGSTACKYKMAPSLITSQEIKDWYSIR